MLVQFGNNWIQKIPRTAKLDDAVGRVQFWLSSEFFSSNYFQIGQHVVLLHIQIGNLSIILFFFFLLKEKNRRTQREILVARQGPTIKLNTLTMLNTGFKPEPHWQGCTLSKIARCQRVLM